MYKSSADTDCQIVPQWLSALKHWRPAAASLVWGLILSQREAGHWYLVLSTRSLLASSHLNPSLDNSQLESKQNLGCHLCQFQCLLQELCLQSSKLQYCKKKVKCRRSVVGNVSVWFETRGCFVFQCRVELQEGWLGGGWRANYQVSVWKSSAPTS